MSHLRQTKYFVVLFFILGLIHCNHKKDPETTNADANNLTTSTPKQLDTSTHQPPPPPPPPPAAPPPAPGGNTPGTDDKTQTSRPADDHTDSVTPLTIVNSPAQKNTDSSIVTEEQKKETPEAKPVENKNENDKASAISESAMRIRLKKGKDMDPNYQSRVAVKIGFKKNPIIKRAFMSYLNASVKIVLKEDSKEPLTEERLDEILDQPTITLPLEREICKKYFEIIENTSPNLLGTFSLSQRVKDVSALYENQLGIKRIINERYQYDSNALEKYKTDLSKKLGSQS